MMCTQCEAWQVSASCMLGSIILHSSTVSSGGDLVPSLIFTTLGSRNCYSHLTDEESETQTH